MRKRDPLMVASITTDPRELLGGKVTVVLNQASGSWTPTAEDLKALTGRYYSDELLATFDVTPGKDGLAVQANYGNTVEFKPVERDTFQIGPMLIHFTRDKSGKATGLEYSNPLLRKVNFSRAVDR